MLFVIIPFSQRTRSFPLSFIFALLVSPETPHADVNAWNSRTPSGEFVSLLASFSCTRLDIFLPRL
jgi:hypothetical protein